MKVKRKDAMQATLNALRSFVGSSSTARSAWAPLSSSCKVGVEGTGFSSGSDLSFGSTSVEESDEAAIKTELLMERVDTQEYDSGRARDTTTVTIRPVIMAARLPASVEYSSPVVETVTAPKY